MAEDRDRDATAERRSLEDRRADMGTGINFSIKELFEEIRDEVKEVNRKMTKLQLEGSIKSQDNARDYTGLETRVRTLENDSASKDSILKLGIAVLVALIGGGGAWITILLRGVK